MDLIEIGLEGAGTLLRLASLVPTPASAGLAMASTMVGVLAQAEPEVRAGLGAVQSAAAALWDEVMGEVRSGRSPTANHVARATLINEQWSSYVTRGRNPVSAIAQ